MIEPVIVDSIPEYDMVTEYLDRIKRQFTGSSKTYKESVHWLFKDICHSADEAAGDKLLIWKWWHKRAQDASSKLRHCRSCHISRGRIERLVKNDILPPLELSDLEQCIECIKGKYVKKIKKDDKQRAGI